MTGADVADAAAAAWALLRAQLRVWTRPTGRLVRDAAMPARDGSAAPDPARLERTVRRASLAVARVVRRTPLRPSCLVRSLALAELLSWRGVPGGLIRVGVRRDGKAFDAHAWVELDGRVIGDDPRHVRRFTPLVAVTLVGRR